MNDAPEIPAKQPSDPAEPETAALESSPVTDEAVTAIVSAIHTSIQQLQADFETKIKYDDSKEHTIDALHRELQDYRADLVLKIMRPLVQDLLTLYDDIGQIIDRQPTELNVDASALLDQLEGIRTDIEEMLARHGYELFEAPDEEHDSNSQRVQKVIETDVASQHLMIARRVRKGVRYGDKIIRPESVDIYRYAPSDTG